MMYLFGSVLFALGQLGRISLFNQNINGYLYEILYAFFIGSLLFKYRTAPFKTILTNFSFSVYFVGWLLCTFVLSLFAYSPLQNSVAALYLARLLFYLGGLFVLTFHLNKSKVARRDLHGALALYCLLTFIFSIVQYIFYPNLRNLSYLGWDPHQFRVFGTSLDTSIVAALFGLIIIHLIFREKNERYLVIPVFIASLFTYARGFYVSMFVTLGYFAARTKKILQFVAFISIVASTIFMLPQPGGEGVDLSRTSSIVSRVADYESAMQLWQKKPITGIGYNHIRYEKGAALESHAGASYHSSFLIILVTTGIVGFVLFIGMLAQFTVITPVSAYMTLFLAVYSLSDNVLLHPFVLFFYTVLLAYEISGKKKK